MTKRYLIKWTPFPEDKPDGTFWYEHQDNWMSVKAGGVLYPHHLAKQIQEEKANVCKGIVEITDESGKPIPEEGGHEKDI